MNRNKRMVICAVVTILLVLIDQFTKKLAYMNLKDSAPFVILNNILEFYYLPNGNTGAAFGMLQGHQLLFSIIAIVVCAGLVYIIYRMPCNKKYNLLIALFVMIIAGGIGNMIDRVKQNYVIDFIYFEIIDFPIFNVADIYVSVATVLLVISVLFIYKDSDIKEIEDSVLGFNRNKKDKSI